jgi:hypothetical protein
MKQCPQCDRTYDDDSLRFCLEDGALLKASGPPAADPNATLVYGSRETWEKQLAQEEVERAPPPIPRSYKNAGHDRRKDELVHRPQTSRLLVGGVLAIAVILLVGGVLGAAYLFSQRKHDQTLAATANTSNSNLKESSASPKQDNSATKSSEKATSTDGLNTKGSPLQIKVTASSVRYSVQSNTYDPANTIDGSQATAWIEGKDGPGAGEWVRFDFDREINLHRILILPGYFKSPAIWAANNRISAASFSFSDGTKRVIDFPDRMERQKVDVGSIRTRWVRIELEDFYFGKDPDTAISEVAFEWEP